MRILFLCLSALLILPSAFAQSAEDIFREVDRRQRQVQSQRVEIDMEIADGQGRTRTSSMILLIKGGTDGSSRALAMFTAPSDIRGTGMLTLHTPEDNEQMIFVPALDQVQRVDGSLRQERLGGSDLTFEDISPRDPDDYTLRLIRTTDDAWIIRATLQPGATSAYGKLVLMIDRQRYTIRRTDFYDSRLRRIKRMVASQFVEVLPGAWQPDRISVEDEDSGRSTTLTFTSRDSRTSLPDALFTEEQLRRGAEGL